MFTDIHVLYDTDKISEVPTKILKEIAECENAKNFQELDRTIMLAHIRDARSHTFDFLDVGVLSVACDSVFTHKSSVVSIRRKNYNYTTHGYRIVLCDHSHTLTSVRVRGNLNVQV